jgi:hypothetical protein
MGRPKGLGFCTKSQFVRLIFFLQNHALSPAFGRCLIGGVTADIDLCTILSWPVNGVPGAAPADFGSGCRDTPTEVQSEEHGGRYYYLESLATCDLRRATGSRRRSACSGRERSRRRVRGLDCR